VALDLHAVRRRAAVNTAGDHGEAPGRDGEVAVLLVCLAQRHGGVDVRVLDTARALARQGWPFTVAVLEGSPLHARLTAEGLPAAPLARRRSDPRLVLDLARAARAVGARVVDSHNTQSQYWGTLAALALGVPGRIATVHVVYREAYPAPGRRRLHEGALRLARRAGCRFITVSTTVRDDLVRLGVPAGRIMLSLNGIEPLAATPAPTALPTDPSWPEDAVVVAVIGRLEPVKGHRYLVEALGQLDAETARRVRVIVVGEGREEARLKALVAERGLERVVRFVGFRADIPAVLAAVDLVCMPSLAEGLPYTALEAGRQAVPLLASETDGIAAAYTDGENAFLVPPGDARALARRLGEIVAAPERRTEVGRASRELVATRFSVEHMTEETLAAYRRAAAGSRGDW
jgi:glycosyltransferase involved in cell wall biosynthesis